MVMAFSNSWALLEGEKPLPERKVGVGVQRDVASDKINAF